MSWAAMCVTTQRMSVDWPSLQRAGGGVDSAPSARSPAAAGRAWGLRPAGAPAPRPASPAALRLTSRPASTTTTSLGLSISCTSLSSMSTMTGKLQPWHSAPQRECVVLTSKSARHAAPVSGSEAVTWTGTSMPASAAAAGALRAAALTGWRLAGAALGLALPLGCARCGGRLPAPKSESPASSLPLPLPLSDSASAGSASAALSSDASSSDSDAGSDSSDSDASSCLRCRLFCLPLLLPLPLVPAVGKPSSEPDSSMPEGCCESEAGEASLSCSGEVAGGGCRGRLRGCALAAACFRGVAAAGGDAGGGGGGSSGSLSDGACSPEAPAPLLRLRPVASPLPLAAAWLPARGCCSRWPGRFELAPPFCAGPCFATAAVAAAAAAFSAACCRMASCDRQSQEELAEDVANTQQSAEVCM